MQTTLRTGLTLIEIVISILLLSVGALALAGSSALMVMRLAESGRGAVAVSVARTRSESSFARSCEGITSGGEQLRGVRSDWSIAANPGLMDLRQRVTYPTRRGSHAEDFLTAVPCE